MTMFVMLYLIFGVGLEGEEDVWAELDVVLLGDGERLQPPSCPPAPPLHQSEVATGVTWPALGQWQLTCTEARCSSGSTRLCHRPRVSYAALRPSCNVGSFDTVSTGVSSYDYNVHQKIISQLYCVDFGLKWVWKYQYKHVLASFWP